MLKLLFGKRRIRLKSLTIAPAAVAIFFFGLALEDAGPAGAVPYGIVALLTFVYVLRPMFIVWAPAFAAFVSYGVLIAVGPHSERVGEWLLFFAFGSIPALFLWFVRPRTYVEPLGHS